MNRDVILNDLVGEDRPFAFALSSPLQHRQSQSVVADASRCGHQSSSQSLATALPLDSQSDGGVLQTGTHWVLLDHSMGPAEDAAINTLCMGSRPKLIITYSIYLLLIY